MEKNINFATNIVDIANINPIFSKGRVRILYPYDNKNSTYISKETAIKMADTLPYIPVVGVFLAEKDDFDEHKESYNMVKKVYGVVPENPNIAWEEVEEEDGTINSYLSADVYLWTGRYEEAERILTENKRQSMELDPKTIEGRWYYENGARKLEITKAFFSALCVLGDDVEPCFESAKFYIQDSFTTDYNHMLSELRNMVATSNTNNDDEGGEKQMIFKLSHDDTHSKLRNALNPKKDDDGYTVYEFGIVDVYDDYVVIYEWATSEHYRIPYVVEDNEVVLDEEKKVKVTLTDLTLEEEELLKEAKTQAVANYDALKASYDELEASNEGLTADYTELLEKVTTIETSLEEANTSFAAEKEELSTQLQEAETKLANFKTREKEAIFAQYSKLLSEEEMLPVREKIAEYTLEDIEGKLAVIAVRKQTTFSVDEGFGLMYSNHGSNPAAKEGWEELVISLPK